MGPPPAARELLGAAHWRHGQVVLGLGRDREAARAFVRSAAEFAAAADLSPVARQELPARQAASFVGQTVALLLAGESEAAQRLFSRTDFTGVVNADPIARFAAGLFELCEELQLLPASERAEIAAGLRVVVLQTRLVVGFFDGRQAVSLAWQSGTL
jgi:hypothetical protein